MAGKDATNGSRQPAWFIDFDEDGFEEAACSSRGAVRSQGSGSTPRDGTAGATRNDGPSPGMIDLLLLADAKPRPPRTRTDEAKPGSDGPGAGPPSDPGFAHEGRDIGRVDRDTDFAGAAADEGGSEVHAGERAVATADDSPAGAARHPSRHRRLPLAALAIVVVAGSALTLGELAGPAVQPDDVDSTSQQPNDPDTGIDREAERRKPPAIAVTSVAVLSPPSELVLPIPAGGATASIGGKPAEIGTLAAPTEAAVPVAPGPAATTVPAPALIPPVGEPATQLAMDGPVERRPAPGGQSATLSAPRSAPNARVSAGTTSGNDVVSRSGPRHHPREEAGVGEEHRPRLQAHARGSHRPIIDRPVQAAVSAEPGMSRPNVKRRSDTSHSVVQLTRPKIARATRPKPTTPRVARAEGVPVLSLPAALRPTPF